MLAEAAIRGLTGMTAQYQIPSEQLHHMYQMGSTPNRGNPDEFRILAAQAMTEELELRRDELTLDEWLDRMAEVHNYLKSKNAGLVANEEVSLGSAPDVEILPKWESGFEPFDAVLGGFYQGIMTLMAKSGHGKTSVMLTLMEMIRHYNMADEVWFYETEIPKDLMLYRLRPARRRTQFKETDRLILGNVTSSGILQEITERPNKNRVIFLDSPDVMAGGLGESKRFGIEGIYRDLVAIKERSLLVVAASQVRRKDRANLTMESVAEAWTKVHYSDMLIGMTKMGRTINGLSQVRLSVSKNRFGIPDQDITFSYNYADLSWELTGGRPTSTTTESEEDW